MTSDHSGANSGAISEVSAEFDPPCQSLIDYGRRKTKTECLNLAFPLHHSEGLG